MFKRERSFLWATINTMQELAYSLHQIFKGLNLAQYTSLFLNLQFSLSVGEKGTQRTLKKFHRRRTNEWCCVTNERWIVMKNPSCKVWLRRTKERTNNLMMKRRIWVVLGILTSERFFFSLVSLIFWWVLAEFLTGRPRFLGVSNLILTSTLALKTIPQMGKERTIKYTRKNSKTFWLHWLEHLWISLFFLFNQGTTMMI